MSGMGWCDVSVLDFLRLCVSSKKAIYERLYGGSWVVSGVDWLAVSGFCIGNIIGFGVWLRICPDLPSWHYLFIVLILGFFFLALGDCFTYQRKD